MVNIFKAIFKGIKKVLDTIKNIIAPIINLVLLAIVYFIGLGIVFLIGKLTKRKFLEYSKKTKTYWQDYEKKYKSNEDYYKMY